MARLPYTDGSERFIPQPVTETLKPERFLAAQRACDGPCVTPFGTPLGRTDGVEARSNCVSTCVRLESSFVAPDDPGRLQIARAGGEHPEHLEYAGLTYQCVEYARRWWIHMLGLTFGDVPTAADILSLTEGTRLADRATIPLGRSLNGSARRTPKRGDLLIYAADPSTPEWRAGHVAVVVDTDLEQGWVALAEQNYTIALGAIRSAMQDASWSCASANAIACSTSPRVEPTIRTVDSSPAGSIRSRTKPTPQRRRDGIQRPAGPVVSKQRTQEGRGTPPARMARRISDQPSCASAVQAQAAVLVASCSMAGLAPAPRISMRLGFIASGTSRTRSMCSRPFSRRASWTFT